MEHIQDRGVVESRSADESQDGLEKAVAQVWCDIFRREHISRNDNFFELGGNSLLGMDLTQMLATRLGIRVSPVMLFLNPSIREMTEAIAAERES